MCYVTVTYYVTLTISLLIKYMSCKQTFLGMCYVICYVTPTMTSLSHTWLRGQLGDGTPHPDDAENNGQNSTRSRGRRNKTSCMPDEYGVTTRRIADRDARELRHAKGSTACEIMDNTFFHSGYFYNNQGFIFWSLVHLVSEPHRLTWGSYHLMSRRQS